MANEYLPEIYHPQINSNHPDHGPEVMPQQPDANGGNQGYFAGGGNGHQSVPPYKNEYSSNAQPIPPQTTWSPPPQGYQQPPQQIFPPQPQQAQPAEKSRICGMKRVVFWIVFAIILIIIIGVAVGAGVGISMKNKNSSGYKPFALELGAWNIQNVPLSQYNGICSQDYTTAVAGCGPLTFPFTVSKSGDNYQITNSPYADMNGILTPPLFDGDMYSKNSYTSGQAPYVTSPCIASANVTVKLGKNRQYEFSNEHYSKSTCKLDNDLTSTANQGCNCYWYGYTT